jgi:beta-lactam-binding protein with PASTA domain
VIFDASSLEPPLDLPVINFRRVDMPSDIPVPLLVGDPMGNAKAQLKSLGLEHETVYVTVAENSNAALSTVVAQDPLPGTRVPANSRVRLTQNVKPGTDKFMYVRLSDAIRHTQWMRQGG